MNEILLLFIVLFGGLIFIYATLYINKKPEVGIYWFVFLSSITMMPELPVVGSRLAVADFLMIYVIVVATIKGELFRRPPHGTHQNDRLAQIFIVMCVLSSLVSLFDGTDLTRVFLFMVIYVYGYLSFRLILRIIDTPEKFYRVCLFWGAGAVLVSVVGFLASTGIYRPDWTYDPIINRISSTMKLSGQVASYLGPAFFIFVYFAMSRGQASWKRWLSIALMGMSIVVLLGTGSRISFAIIIFLVAYATYVVLTVSDGGVRKVPIMISVVFGMTGLSLFISDVWMDFSQKYSLLGTSPFERAIRIFSETNRNTSGDLADWGGTRFDEISVALGSVWDQPIFGVGSGMFSQTYRINEIHNTYISILAENGIPAFVIMILWWFGVGLFLKRGVTRSRSTEAKVLTKLIFGAFLVLTLYQLTTNGFRQRPFWFIPAIALAGMATIRRNDEMKLARPVISHQNRGILPEKT